MLSDQTSQNKKAIWWMLFAVVLYSVSPLLFYVGDAGGAIFLFNAVFQMSAIVTSIVILWGRYGKHPLFCVQSIRVSVVNLRRPEVWWACIGVFGYIVFAWSLNHVDVSVAAVLFEIWPIFFIMLTGYLFRGESRKGSGESGEKRYKKISINKWLLVFVSFCGLALVTLSQTERSEDFFSSLGDTPIGGVLLVLMAALLAALTAPFSLRWGNQVAREATKTGGASEEMFFVIVAMMVVRIFGCVVAACLGFALGENLTAGGFAAASICGVFLASAGIIFRYANTLTDNLGINALAYGIPVFSLVWLGIFELVNVPQPDYLVIGCVTIIVANVLISYEARARGET